VQLAGATEVTGASQLTDGALLGELPPPFGSFGEPAPTPVPTVAPLPVHILPAPPAPTTPVSLPAVRPTAPPPSPPVRRQPPAVLGPGSSTRAPQPVLRQPVRTPASTPLPVPSPPADAQLDGPAAQTLAALNQSRAQGGLGRLRADAALTRAAIEHAAQIAAQGQMTHSGYVDYVNGQGVSWQGLGEVLGAKAPAPDPSTINQLWMQSPEHRPIILDPRYNSVGIGWARSDTGWWYVATILMY
jgi:uncharacterized protein YkwD